jgi:hypothetical protein
MPRRCSTTEAEASRRALATAATATKLTPRTQATTRMTARAVIALPARISAV